MAQIVGNAYQVRYNVVTPNAATVDPPLVKGGGVILIVLAANQAAVQAVVNSAASLTGSQVAKIEYIEQLLPGAAVWQ